MKKRAFAVIVMVLSAAVFPCDRGFCAENPQFSVDFGGWFASLNPQSESGNGAGSIDISGDLGIDERKTLFPVSASLRLGGPYAVFVDFYSFSSSGSKPLDSDLTYNNVTFAARTQTSGKYKQDTLRFGMEYNIKSDSVSTANLRGGVLYSKMELDIANSVASASDSLNVPFPFIGVDLEQKLSNEIAVGGGLEGMAFSFQDYTTTYFSFDVFAKYFLTNNITARAGYRYENLDSDKDEKSFSTELNGAYLGLNLAF